MFEEFATMKISTVAVLALVASLFACALAAPGAEQADERTLVRQGDLAGMNNDHNQRRNLLDSLVGNIICDATGSCHDNYGHYGYREDRDNSRNNGGYDNNRGGYDNNRGGYGNNNYGRKLMNLVSRTLTGRTLKDSLVGDIICESTGSCHDNYGHYGYREDRDDRRYNGGGGYGNDRGGYGNRDYDNNRGGGYDNNYGRKLKAVSGRTLKDSLVGDIICDATGSCHDDYGHYGYREDRDDRRYNGGGYGNDRGGYDNGGYDNNRGGGWNNNYGRKLMNLVGRTLKGRTLKDSLVGDIICESTGSCHDNYGHYGYREDRDDRRYNGGGGGYDNNRGGGYDNNRGGGYDNNRGGGGYNNNYGK